MRLVSPATEIVERLADPRLLPPARFDELVATILPRCDDWRIVGPELIYRGWLTPFQALLLHRGRGDELVLGSYVLLEPLGEGGMGHVYRARNWKFDTFVAVKVIRPDRAAERGSAGRFLREVRAHGAICHPHLVHAVDAGLDGGRLYCAMEYVPGTDLGRLLRDRGALSVEIAWRYTNQLAAALSHISALGLVHRDVKPANVLVTADGSAVKLGDLGLARSDRPEYIHAGLTRIGVMVGTPDYIAPEQIRDSRAADIRSDLYSLGATLYHMLTGRPPFDGLGTMDKLRHHQEVDPVPVEALRPDVPAELATVVRTLLAKRPRDRYQDPAEVASALRARFPAPGDTVTDAAAQTVPDLFVPVPECPLPRTDEIPIDHLRLVTEETISAEPAPQTWQEWGLHWANRLHWLIAALIAGTAMGFVIGRGN
jgi:eukaryotic-like serine/threonine-protein kinase